MKRSFSRIARVTCAIATVAFLGNTPARAAIQFDQNVTNNAIFGSGNDNGSFTTDRDNGIELGLRGKLRHNAAGLPENTFNSNGDGTYSFQAIVAPTQLSPTAEWSFEWSINSNYDGNGAVLDAYTYVLSVDSDPTAGTNFASPFDPINVGFADHSIGNNGTGNGLGAEATDPADYTSLIANNNLAQNSWKAHWFIAPFDPTVDGTYTFNLAAYSGSTQLAFTTMDVIVGTGGVIPEPSTIVVWLGLGIFFATGRRRRM